MPSTIYKQPYLGQHKAFGQSGLPWSLGNDVQYKDGDCPNAEAIIADCIYLPVSERFDEQQARDTVTAVRKVHDYYYKK